MGKFIAIIMSLFSNPKEKSVPQEPISIIKLQEQVLEMEKAEQQKKLS
jgi:hypothetical protein